jgi:spore coat polysaccharide biosynthesis predicted glycosyltransferase SpsG
MGAGHVMRSSAIAEELISRGNDVIFVGRISDLSWVEERITSLGFSQVYSDTYDFKSNPKSDVLILDSYNIEEEDPFVAQQNWFHIIAIVDEKTPNYSCTLRIHPGLDSNWTGNSDTSILSGPKYIPIRSSLIGNKKSLVEEAHKLKIAVIAGGSDPFGLVNEIAKILVTFSEEFIVYLFSKSIADSNLDSRFRYMEIGNRFDELTSTVDLILTTASTSSLEFFLDVAAAVKPRIEANRILLQKLAKSYQDSYRFWVEMAAETQAPYDARGVQRFSSVASGIQIKA